MILKFIAKRLGVSAITKMMERRAVKKIQDHEKRIKRLEKDTHPRADWICMECGCVAKKVIKKRRK